ncbi:hypothetical protein D9758_017065 [Tetrapyrgos nigripes]|uniref:CCHC-type domain-containing protein n=1 Tax=Tetrapyrgos nigripes TaxID=182062 RepID=A0A8H5CFJ8_9AGAR|nr:hypothetical protein D9758_017065 [Tetrapyrgos nigripes]
MWALSYFQTGRAATYCQSLIDHDHLYGSSRFNTWEEFEKEFIREFMPEDKRTQASLTLEDVSYFQGTASVDEHVDNFCALITMVPIQFPTPAAAPIAAPRAPAPAQAPLSQGIPQEVDTLRQRFLARRTCYTCGKTGHFSAACPDCQCEHVCIMDMSVDDWQEIAEAYVAFQDFQAAPMNKPAQEDFAKDQE